MKKTKNPFKIILAIVIVSLVCVGIEKIAEHIFGAANVFVFSVIVVAFFGIIVVPFMQIKRAK